MARVRNKPDSYAPLLVELQFVNASQPVPLLAGVIPGTGGQEVNIKPQEYLRSIRIDDNSESVWTGTIVLFDREDDYLESLLTPLNPENRVVRFRFGWDTGGGLVNVPWLKGRVLSWSPNYTYEGTELTLNVIGTYQIDASVDKQSRSFQAGLNPSTIVSSIAQERGWKTEDVDGKPTIEVSDKVTDKPLQSKNKSDLAFIRESVLPLASDKDGLSFEFFVDASDAVHFHTRRFLLSKSNPEVAATYTYARDTKGDVVAFTPQVDTLFSQIHGSENAIYIFTDEVTGQRIQLETTREGGPDNLIVTFPDEKVVNNEGDGIKARIPIPARSLDEGRQIIRARYDAKRKVAYAATLDVRGTHAVRVADHVAIRYFKRDGQAHYLSGVYWVRGVQHDVSPGEWKTVFDLVRQGSKAIDIPPENMEIKPDKKQSVKEQDSGDSNLDNHLIGGLYEPTVSKKVNDG